MIDYLIDQMEQLYPDGIMKLLEVSIIISR